MAIKIQFIKSFSLPRVFSLFSDIFFKIFFRALVKALRIVLFVKVNQFLKENVQNLWKSQKNDFHVDYLYPNKDDEF